MKIEFSRSALKFIEKLGKKDKEKVRLKIKSLLISIEVQGIIPFRELDIKKLNGEWAGFFRMRVGKIRTIFKIDKDNKILLIYEIDFRGSIYKK